MGVAIQSSVPSQAGPSNLIVRLATALVGLPILLGVTWAGDPWFSAAALLVALVAAWEFGRLAVTAAGDPWRPLLYAGAALMVLEARFAVSDDVLPAVLLATLLLSLLWSVMRYESGGSGMGWFWTLGGVLYVGWLLSHFVSLRQMPQGFEWVLLAFSATFINDTAAYAVGRLFGRHKLSPRLSPGKTWEGALGAVALTTLGVPLIGQVLVLPVSASFWALGVAISFAAQTGDLAESLLKRTAGVKDVSNLMPGHGGLLDRMDSLVFVGPLVYYYVRWFVTPS